MRITSEAIMFDDCVNSGWNWMAHDAPNRHQAAAQKLDQSFISCRRFSNKSPRRYAASTLFLIAWARAISTTSLG